jgi:hypothetical protein
MWVVIQSRIDRKQQNLTNIHLSLEFFCIISNKDRLTDNRSFVVPINHLSNICCIVLFNKERNEFLFIRINKDVFINEKKYFDDLFVYVHDFDVDYQMTMMNYDPNDENI